MHSRFEHLLDIPVPFRQVVNELHAGEQARHGLTSWLDSFEPLTVVACATPERETVETRNSHWVSYSKLVKRVLLFSFPSADPPDHVFHQFPGTATVFGCLSDEIPHLQISREMGVAEIGLQDAVRFRRRFARS